MKLKIKKIDRYGFQGREFHPSEKDEGLVVRVVSFFIEHLHDDGDYASSADFDREKYEVLDEVEKNGFHVYQTLTDDGRKLTLIGHEVEPV